MEFRDLKEECLLFKSKFYFVTMMSLKSGFIYNISTIYVTLGIVKHFDFLKCLTSRLKNERKTMDLVFKHEKLKKYI